MKLLVDSAAFMEHLERDLGRATRSVAVQTMSFEGDEAGKRFARLLLGRKDLGRTLLVDRYSLYDLNDRLLPAPWNALSVPLWRERASTLDLVRQLRADGADVCWTNPMGLLLRRFAARNHKKSVLIDGQVAYIGGLNLCDHNFEWHDLMLRVEDARLGAFLNEDLVATRRGKNLPSRGRFGDLEVLLFDGADNARLNQPLFDVIGRAASSIVVQSAYMTFPFFEHLAGAVQRGVRVTLVAPERNNKPKISAYTQWAAANAGIDLRLDTGRMSHVKAMLIDGNTLVMGSSNFDYFSYTVQQEVVLIVRDRGVVEQYRREVLEPGLARSVAPTRTFSPAWQAWRERGFRAGARLVAAMARP